MRIQSTLLIGLGLLGTGAAGQTTAPPRRGQVPTSVLSAIGLSALEEIATPEDPRDFPPEPAAAPEPQTAIATPTPLESPRNAVAKLVNQAVSDRLRAERAVSQAEIELDTARQMAARAESASRSLVRREADAQSRIAAAERELTSARASSEAMQQEVAKLSERAQVLADEGQAMLHEYAALEKLIKQLAAIHAQLKEVAEESGDGEVAAARSGLEKTIVSKGQEHAERKQLVLAKSREFNLAKEARLAAESEAQRLQEAVAAAESTLQQATQQALTVPSEIEKQKADLTAARARVDLLAAALESARGRLDSAQAAAAVATTELAAAKAPPPAPPKESAPASPISVGVGLSNP